MKKLILLPVVTLLLSLNLNYLTAQQLVFFDTVKVFKQSEIYDYSNPVFDEQLRIGYSNNLTSKVAYIRSDQNSSSVIVSHFDFDSELQDYVIVKDNSDKRSISVSSNMIVWESNLSGKYGIYYSVFQNGSYTTPSLINNPILHDDVNLSVQMNGNAACLVYQSDSNVYAMFYSNGNWGAFTPVTNSNEGKCFSPKIGSSWWQFFITYTSRSGAGYQTIYRNLSFTENNFSIGNPISFHSSNNYLKTTSAGKGEQQSIAFESLIGNQYRIFNYNFFGSVQEAAIDIHGDKRDLKLTRFGFLTDGTSDWYEAFSNKRDDSLFVVVKESDFMWGARNKSFYIGNSNSVSFDLSNPVFLENTSNQNYRLRLMWTKEINGKMALLESNCYDDLTNLQTNASEVPSSFSLHQNFPNPFNPSTTISFDIPHAALVKLTVFDALGKEVATLVNENLQAGVYQYQFTTDKYQLPSGVYFYRLQAGEFVDTKRFVLLK